MFHNFLLVNTVNHQMERHLIKGTLSYNYLERGKLGAQLAKILSVAGHFTEIGFEPSAFLAQHLDLTLKLLHPGTLRGSLRVVVPLWVPLDPFFTERAPVPHGRVLVLRFQ